MRDLLRAATGQPLNLSDYDADFYREVQSVSGSILKTERIQTFREPGSPSWEAYEEGRWDDALRLADQPDPALEEFFRQLDAHGSGLRRLRIVELPLSPYLLWELNFFRHRVAAGEEIHVLDAVHVADLEAAHGTVPEFMVVGSQAVYEVRYDDSGTPLGADKYVDPSVVNGCRKQVEGLFAQAEPFERFFGREVDGRAPSTRHL
jgi:hypothetical protein